MRAGPDGIATILADIAKGGGVAILVLLASHMAAIVMHRPHVLTRAIAAAPPACHLPAEDR